MYFISQWVQHCPRTSNMKSCCRQGDAGDPDSVRAPYIHMLQGHAVALKSVYVVFNRISYKTGNDR